MPGGAGDDRVVLRESHTHGFLYAFSSCQPGHHARTGGSRLRAAIRAQVTAKTLVGKAVSDDAQYKEINGAITRFGDRDIDGCRAILERARNNNPKLPPPGVMMAMLWLNVNQLQPARAELEQTTIKFPNDPEGYLMLADLAFQDRRVTDSAVLFERATQLSAAYDENPKRKRDFEIRCNAGTAAV